jgi:hypothetical protein
MPLSNSILAYDDVREILDKALAAEKGLAITVKTRGKAVSLRQRCYKFRSLAREESFKLYGPGDTRRGHSPYEELHISISDDDQTRLIIRRQSTEELQIEELK